MKATAKPTRCCMGTSAGSNEWTEIDSYFEGRFLERIGMGAYKKTFKERADQLRVLFQHGKDPMIGEKPIAVPERLDEEEAGAYHESRLLDTCLN
jgi:phage head maturation protease